MTIETKFSVNETVWIMKDNKPYQFKVYQIKISIDENSISEIYVNRIMSNSILNIKFYDYDYSSNDCFATKEELLNSFLTDK